MTEEKKAQTTTAPENISEKEKLQNKPFKVRFAWVQQNLKAPKSQYNVHGGFNYRSCEDILTALKPLLDISGLMLTISDDIRFIGDRFYIEATVVIEDLFSDKSMTFKSLARETLERKGMDSSQITGAASSYARKYALNGAFNIDDTKDADSMNNGSTPPQKQPQGKKENAGSQNANEKAKPGSQNQNVKLATDDQKHKILELGINLDQLAKAFKYKNADELKQKLTFDQASQAIKKKLEKLQSESKPKDAAFYLEKMKSVLSKQKELPEPFEAYIDKFNKCESLEEKKQFVDYVIGVLKND